VLSQAADDSPVARREIRAEPLGVIAAGLDDLSSTLMALLLAVRGDLRSARVGELAFVLLQAPNLGSTSRLHIGA
jgi:hypothetical protein